MHGAPGNLNKNRRRAVALRWLGDDIRFTGNRPEISPPITGGLKEGNKMECEEFPNIKFD